QSADRRLWLDCLRQSDADPFRTDFRHADV
ncbi:uncharacterized protein METZ01_LOCUS497319, partial [marine metagenome]